jgi:hypothetical protein
VRIDFFFFSSASGILEHPTAQQLPSLTDSHHLSGLQEALCDYQLQIRRNRHTAVANWRNGNGSG